MTEDTTQRIPEPLSAEEEAKFRESVAMLGDGGDYAPLQWSNTTAIRLLDTLDRANERIAVLRKAAETIVRFEREGRIEDCNGVIEDLEAALGATETEPGEGSNRG